MTISTLKNLIREVVAEARHQKPLPLNPKYATLSANVAAKAIEAAMRQNGYKNIRTRWFDPTGDSGSAHNWGELPTGGRVHISCCPYSENEITFSVERGGRESTRTVASVSDAQNLIKNPDSVFANVDNDPLQGGTIVQVMDYGMNGKEVVIQTKGGKKITASISVSTGRRRK